MLVINRRVNESLMFGDRELKVTAISCKKEKLVKFSWIGIPAKEETRFTLRLHEACDLGAGIWMSVLHVVADGRAPVARIAVTAPKGSLVHRKEVWDAIHGA